MLSRNTVLICINKLSENTEVGKAGNECLSLKALSAIELRLDELIRKAWHIGQQTYTLVLVCAIGMT